MIKLNRTTEYGLIALRHIRHKQTLEQRPVSAREIADRFGLPFEITAKTLQRLKETGLIQSVQGVHGGYTLAMDLHNVNLSQFIRWMEGMSGLVTCCNPTTESGCEYHAKCEIHPLMNSLNIRINEFLSKINLVEILSEPQPVSQDQVTTPCAESHSGVFYA